jgi:hypothetical protein
VIGQRYARKIIRDVDLETCVFRNFIHRRVGVKLAKPQASVFIKIEHAEIGDEPLRPLAAMAKINPRTTVGSAMAKTGNKIGSLLQ